MASPSTASVRSSGVFAAPFRTAHFAQQVAPRLAISTLRVIGGDAGHVMLLCAEAGNVMPVFVPSLLSPLCADAGHVILLCADAGNVMLLCAEAGNMHRRLLTMHRRLQLGL